MQANINEDAAVPMIIDDNSLDQVVPPALVLDNAFKYAMPLHCHTATASVLRNYRHNPLISGSNLQLSPVLMAASPLASTVGDGDASSVASLEDSMPPALTACDTDACSDSGIDDNSLVNSESGSPQKQLRHEHMDVASVPAAPPPQQQEESSQQLEQVGSNATSRKSSISFIDSSNPLLRTPYLMDLCNDDYNMTEGGFELDGFDDLEIP